MTEQTRGIDTRLQRPRIGAASGGEPVSPPVYQSSTYVLPTPELGAEIAPAGTRNASIPAMARPMLRT